MELHNDSGEVSVIIDVTYTEDEKFIDFLKRRGEKTDGLYKISEDYLVA